LNDLAKCYEEEIEEILFYKYYEQLLDIEIEKLSSQRQQSQEQK
jgi:predicted house-cleaning noncanonical NTP pyrophosphatase (MazG superfamily)